MNTKSVFFITAVLSIFLLSSIAVTANNVKVVDITRVSTSYDVQDTVVVSLGLKSDDKLTDSKVTVSIPELGIRSRSNVDLTTSGKKRSVVLMIPDPETFDPYVRIVFQSDEGRRVIYRPLILW
jgi:hypothetical protein